MRESFDGRTAMRSPWPMITLRSSFFRRAPSKAARKALFTLMVLLPDEAGNISPSGPFTKEILNAAPSRSSTKRSESSSLAMATTLKSTASCRNSVNSSRSRLPLPLSTSTLEYARLSFTKSSTMSGMPSASKSCRSKL